MDLCVYLHATVVLKNLYLSLNTPSSTYKAILYLYHLDFPLLKTYLQPPTKGETPQKHLQDYSCYFSFGTSRASAKIIGFLGLVKKT